MKEASYYSNNPMAQVLNLNWSGPFNNNAGLAQLGERQTEVKNSVEKSEGPVFDPQSSQLFFENLFLRSRVRSRLASSFFFFQLQYIFLLWRGFGGVNQTILF